MRYLKKPLSVLSFVTLTFCLCAGTALADRGQLEIVSEPGDAKIYINGKRYPL